MDSTRCRLGARSQRGRAARHVRLYAAGGLVTLSVALCSLADAQPVPTEEPVTFPGMMSSPAPVQPAPVGSSAERPAPLPPPSAPASSTAAPVLSSPPLPPMPPPIPPPPVQAPEPKPEWSRQGFYFRMLTGISIVSFHGNGPNGSASLSSSGSDSTILIGGALAPRLVLAIALQADQISSKFEGGPYRDAKIVVGGVETDANDKASAGFSSMGGMVDWYPLRSAGLHLGLGAGIGVVAVSNLADGSSLVGTCTTGSAMVGYDWPIARTWALGLALAGSAATNATLKDDDGDKSGYDLTPWTISVSGSVLYF